MNMISHALLQVKMMDESSRNSEFARWELRSNDTSVSREKDEARRAGSSRTHERRSTFMLVGRAHRRRCEETERCPQNDWTTGV
jgi:hypothetical protein